MTADTPDRARRDLVLGGLAAAGILPTFQPDLHPIGTAPFPDYATATDTARAIRARQISSVELTKAVLARIDRINPRLNAIVNVLTESALAQAAAADRALAQGRAPGSFHGVPVTVKDTIEIAGVRTTAGFEPLKNHVPAQDATSVARLRKAGGVIIGNTNVPPLASDWQTNNPIYGRTNNPYDLARTPGGSTGGGAAAVAAGLGALTLGSDIGGSIRIPSHFCGLFGHKPSINVIPIRGHIPPLPTNPPGPPPTLPVIGPLARSADDLMAAVRALGGVDGADAVAYRWTLPAARHARLTDYRVRYVLDHPACPLTSEVRSALEQAITALRKAGVRMEEGWPAGIDPVAQFETYEYLVAQEVFGDQVEDQKLEETRRFAEQGPAGFASLLARVQTDPIKVTHTREGQRIGARLAWSRAFRDIDVFLMPVAFTSAFKHDARPSDQLTIPTPSGERPYLDLLWWIAIATVTGSPATVMPVPPASGSLPVGLQILGPYLEDATPIDFAARATAVLGGFRPPAGL